MKKMKCKICQSNQTKIIKEKLNGYVKGTYFNIYECNQCKTQFINTDSLDEGIYETIYANQNVSGYSKFFNIAQETLKKREPFEYLYKKMLSYSAIFNFVKERQKIKILEIGCGLGYLSYAIHCLGHEVKGIDISKEAISFAKKHFGNFYEAKKIEELTTNERFDLIFSNEVIEHVKNPLKFLSCCKNILKDSGTIILTTPNRDFYKKGRIWQTDLPPVHTYWLNKTSFKYLAERARLKYISIKLPRRSFRKRNKLWDIISTRKSPNQRFFLDEAGNTIKTKDKKRGILFKKFLRKLILFYPIRSISNIIANLFFKEDVMLCVIIQKDFSNQK